MTQASISSFQWLPIESLDLDLKNPRIAKWLEMYGDAPTAEQIALALKTGGTRSDVGGPSFQGLKQSIQTNRGIIHPIIVNKGSDGRLVVIEGNTRAYIYRELRRAESEGLWDTIPAVVYEDLSQATIDAIRLQAHLVGTREWDPYSKAKYLDTLRNKEHLTFSQIVDFCGGDKREIQNYIDAYNDMESYYRPVLDSDQDFDPSRFSAFVELQKPKIYEALVVANFTKTDFAQWVQTQKIFPLNMVRKLPEILRHEKARAIFLKAGAMEAVKALDVPSPDSALREVSLAQLARELSKRIATVQYGELQTLRKLKDTDDVTILYDVKEALLELCRDIGLEDA